MKLIQWLKSSLEGADGKSSSRALTNAWYVVLNTGIAVCTIILAFHVVNQPKPNAHAIDALYVLIKLCVIFNIVILLIFGIVSWQNITESIRAIRGHEEPPKEVKPGDPVEVVVTGTIPEKKEGDV